MIRAEYEAAVCARYDLAVRVAPLKVSIGSWHPSENACHDNVDTWVEAHPEFKATRGWVTYASFGEASFGLTAHSVVCDENGMLFDITPLTDEALRAGMLFIAHEGDQVTFNAMKAQGIFIHCDVTGGKE